ncbi:hypothetical protein J7E29_17725 [Streptomyces sp. ISL-90]|nr:hypothetical protein [Streptomyces sp. ISL-90]
MAVRAVLGVDIGTSSSKGVLVDFDGAVMRSAVREHSIDRPSARGDPAGSMTSTDDHDRERGEREP